MNEILENAVEKYGDDQLVVAMEELAELIQALSKVYRYKDGVYDSKEIYAIFKNAAEEIADVEIMLEQLKIYFENNQTLFYFNDTVGLFKEQKIERLREIMRREDE